METPLDLIVSFLLLLTMDVTKGVAVSTYRILYGAPALRSCKGKSFYNYNSFIVAVDSFPNFGSTRSSVDARREVEAYLANVVDMS